MNQFLDSVRDNSVEAIVIGTKIYKVVLTRELDSKINKSCSCPSFGSHGCKHIMAVGLALDKHYKTHSGYKPSKKCVDEVKHYKDYIKSLNQMNKAELVDLIVKIGGEHNLRSFINTYHHVSQDDEDDYGDRYANTDGEWKSNRGYYDEF